MASAEPSPIRSGHTVPGEVWKCRRCGEIVLPFEAQIDLRVLLRLFPATEHQIYWACKRLNIPSRYRRSGRGRRRIVSWHEAAEIVKLLTVPIKGHGKGVGRTF